jgi:putative heme-binding domain-containing protein
VIKRIPANERTGPAAIDYVEFADGLAGLLPAEKSRALRRDLGDLAVRVIRLGTLPERMAYDKELLVVQAGKPLEIVLGNDDFMPHNFVITKPGALEEVGMLAEASAANPEFQARQFVPNSNKVLLSSRLLQTRETQQLSFTVPATPGVYPYVCTYPGHWRRMYGALYVVADLDAYTANPEAYLAKNPMPVADALLKDRRPRTEWKLEDLALSVEHLEPGRSYNSGKQMFTMASCISCHKVGDQGNDFGPKLTELDPKWKPVDVLREILEPSLRIHEKFKSQVVELKNGKTVTGLVMGEKDGNLLLVENPIETRTESKVSLMPKGLLDKLSRDEVLDLLSFVFAKGDPKHPLFTKSGHGHGH